jgi:N4-(beta-N-acetylglucosaminyl)-L-asparaginase
MRQTVAISTWAWGRTAVMAAAAAMQQGASALDAAVAGAQAVEDDPSVRSVGYGGMGNRIGTISLDASVMDGEDLSCGAVAAVENIRHVARLAQRVLQVTPHVLLAGEGARWFALQQGFPLSNLHTPEEAGEWQRRRPSDSEPQPLGHDTVTTLTMDALGKLAGACTTSGLYFKMPGRVGDSPLIGSGLYVDNRAGAAGGTGVGEEIVRAVGSYAIVEQMRQGRDPQEACEYAVKRVLDNAARRNHKTGVVCFLALAPDGQTGAACTAGSKFPYAIARGGQVETFTAKELG